MRFILSFVLISAFGFAVQTCDKSESKTAKPDVAKTDANSVKTANTGAPASTAHQDEAPRISLEDAKKAYDEGSATIVDARSEESYKVEHIKGAMNIPLADFDNSYKRIPTDKKIIVYCS